MMMRRWVGFVAAVLLVAPPTYAATPERVVVLPVLTGGDGTVSLSSVYADVVESAEAFLDIRVVTDEELFAGEQREMSLRLTACGTDAACIADGLRRHEASMCLIVAVNELSRPAFVALRMANVQERRFVGTADGPLDETEKTIGDAVRRRTTFLLDRAGYVKKSKIEVRPTPANAFVSLVPRVEPDIGTPRVFTVRPGRYRVLATLAGHTAAEATVEIGAAERSVVPVTLEEERSIVQSPWLWIGVGVVVAGAASAGAALLASPGLRCVCASPAGAACPECL